MPLLGQRGLRQPHGARDGPLGRAIQAGRRATVGQGAEGPREQARPTSSRTASCADGVEPAGTSLPGARALLRLARRRSRASRRATTCSSASSSRCDRCGLPACCSPPQQWATLQSTFPTGVCDWSKPGVGEQGTRAVADLRQRAGRRNRWAARRCRRLTSPRRSAIEQRPAAGGGTWTEMTKARLVAPELNP